MTWHARGQEEARADQLARRVAALSDDLVRKTALLEAAERVKEHEKAHLRLASQRLFLRLKGRHQVCVPG